MNRRDGGDGGRDLKRPRHGYDPNGRGRAPPRHYTRQGGFGGARDPPGAPPRHYTRQGGFGGARDPPGAPPRHYTRQGGLGRAGWLDA